MPATDNTKVGALNGGPERGVTIRIKRIKAKAIFLVNA
jgi:hypothetical protein